MADSTASVDMSHPVLNLTPDEKRVFGQLFQQADNEKLGVVTGEVAVKFFERTKLAPQVLGEIWQIADTENRGLLTSAGFCMVLRLIGHYQAGRDPTPELALKPGPLPKFEGLNISGPSPTARAPPAIQPQSSGGVRVPQLSSEKATEYAALFEKSGAHNGVLSGDGAKSIFENARLPNDVLGRIWNLSDTEQRGALGMTEFIIAMHLLASYRSGAMPAVPTKLPLGLYEAASRRGPVPGRPTTSARAVETQIPRQFSGQRAQSPMGRPSYATQPQSAQATGGEWLITAQEKSQYDSLFNKVDNGGQGHITGEQAVQFFSDSGLPEDTLAAIWDLADINSEGQLNRDEFAVAMHLIRQQRRPGATLPSTLPANLVPPSMRNQTRPPKPAHPPVPKFEMPKSASEDLFGLDAITAPPPAQTQQSTGGSTNFSRPLESDPFGAQTSPTSPPTFQPSPHNPAATFKPFMPTSAFGQGLTSQSAGASGAKTIGQARGPQPTSGSGMDDLLGDNDPEVSRKLTQETSELANMSNQIGTLRNQMQEVQSKKNVTAHELSGASSQRRDLELRLSQFRSQYEKEVESVKSLEERLNASRSEIRKLQQDCAMIEGTYQDLQNQHRQFATALDADQRENANLKERIRQMNAEISQLRPQLDKMRSDSRQQKGMVAINKKQFATSEGERDRMRSEMSDLTRSGQDVRSGQPTPQETPTMTSPAASTASQNTNPFFRRAPQQTTDSVRSPTGPSREGSVQQNQRDFESIFGTSFGAPQVSTAPQTSFRTESQAPTFSAQSGQSVKSSEPDVPTPSTSPPASSYQESPRTIDPPAPPESRQFASSLLPLRENVPRNNSFSSSVKVSAPGSRYGGGGAETPTNAPESAVATPSQAERPDTRRTDTGNYSTSMFDRNRTTSPTANAPNDPARTAPRLEEPTDFRQAKKESIPGAFPMDATSPIQPDATGESALSEQSKASTRPSEGYPTSRSDPFTQRDQARGPQSSRVDFDAAFAGFGNRSYQEKQHTGTSANGSVDSQSKFNKEFPPIEDIDQEDESDSTSERGFADNFTTASPKHRSRHAPRPSKGTEPSGDGFFQNRPPMVHTESNASALPTPGAQKSPPTYDQTVSYGPRSSGSNQFPPEFGGLLPSRGDPTSAGGTQSPERSFSTGSGSQSQTIFGGSSNKGSSAPVFSASPPPTDTPASTAPSEAYHSAVSHPSADKGASPQAQTNVPGRGAFSDDFDSGFDDLAEAKEADDKGDDDFIGSRQREGFDEFNPVFDSPAASKSNTMASQQTTTGKTGEDSFADFDFNQGNSSNKPLPQPTATSSQDWDAIFSNLDSSQQKDAQGESPQQQQQQQPSAAQSKPSSSAYPLRDDSATEDSASTATSKAAMPSLGRAVSTGTEHDDPILKKLTGMGYPRNDALGALEKFDYDINKAADYMTAGR